MSFDDDTPDKPTSDEELAAKKAIVLHLSVLSEAILHKSPEIHFVDEDSMATCNVGSGQITLPYIPGNPDANIGLGFHELFHEVNSEPPDWTELALELRKAGESVDGYLEDSQKRRLHLILNSLEDHRIEWVGGNIIYPPADYYLGKMRGWVIAHHLAEEKLGNLAKSPLSLLHLLLDRIDLVKFHRNPETRKVIRRLHNALETSKFRQGRTTRSLYPHVAAVYMALKEHPSGLPTNDEENTIPTAHAGEKGQLGEDPRPRARKNKNSTRTGVFSVLQATGRGLGPGPLFLAHAFVTILARGKL
jgi:hypothetical protein